MANEQSPSFQGILDKIISNAPIKDSYKLTLWANFFADPTFALIEQKFGLLRDEYNILACLTTYGPMTATSVCLVTGRPKNSVSRAVDRLTRRRLIDRRPDATDRRQAILSIRPDGRAAYHEALPLFVEREKLMLGALNRTERKALSDLLTKLMESHANWVRVY